MRISNRAFLFLLAVLSACGAEKAVAPPAAPPHLKASLNLGTVGATELYWSTANAINDSGVVVGYAELSRGDRPRPVEWTPPDYHVTVLPDDGSGFPLVNAIGRDGTVAGSICDSLVTHCRPVYWRDGVLHHLAGFGSVRDVCSCDGHTLVGRTTVNGQDHATIWEDDIPIEVAPPDGYVSAGFSGVAHGYIIGNAYTHTEETGRRNVTSYRWSPTSGWVQLLKEVLVYDVNSRGSVLGGSELIWFDGSDIPQGLGSEGFPTAINDSNVVAGPCGPDPSGAAIEFLPCEWSAALGWHAIGQEPLFDVRGINNSNAAVGEIFDVEQNRSFAMLWRP